MCVSVVCVPLLSLCLTSMWQTLHRLQLINVFMEFRKRKTFNIPNDLTKKDPQNSLECSLSVTILEHAPSFTITILRLLLLIDERCSFVDSLIVECVCINSSLIPSAELVYRHFIGCNASALWWSLAKKHSTSLLTLQLKLRPEVQ